MIHATILNLMHLADAVPAATPGANSTNGSPAGLLIPMICIAIIFYFLIIRPQNQKQKQQVALINSMKTGDKVITAGGIHGLISNVKETTIILKVADNVKIEVDKAGVTTVIKRTEGESAPAA